MTDFTKGPWEVRGLNSDYWQNGCYGIQAEDRKILVGFITRRNTEEGEANARLIAAAPEMYELLDYIASYLTALSKLIPLSGLLINYLSMINDLMARIDGKEEHHE